MWCDLREICSLSGATVSSGFPALLLSKLGRDLGSSGAVERCRVLKQTKASRVNPWKWSRWTTALYCSIVLFMQSQPDPNWSYCCFLVGVTVIYVFQQLMDRTIGMKTSWIHSAALNSACICRPLPRDPAACFSVQLEKVLFIIRKWQLMRRLKNWVLRLKLAAQSFSAQGLLHTFEYWSMWRKGVSHHLSQRKSTVREAKERRGIPTVDL